MDTFKILAKSTNLQKSAPSAGKSKESIPSAGFTSQEISKFDDENHVDTSIFNREPRGTKRKRTLKKNVQHSTQFSKHEITQETSPSRLLNDKRNEHVDEQPNNAVKIHRRSSDEIKQILKQNKLKITVLDQGQQAKQDKISPDKKLEKSRKKRDAPSQLYPEPLTSFAELRTRCKISRRLAENLDSQGYRYPTEVQVGSLPLLLGLDEERGLAIKKPRTKNKSKYERSHIDLLTVAPTGSGKTLAFMVNIIHRLMEDRHAIRRNAEENGVGHQIQALIIAPTHELADQIVNEGRKLALGTGLRVSVMKKGMNLQADPPINDQEEATNEPDSESQEAVSDGGSPRPHPVIKADILVSTPMLLVNAISDNQTKPPKLLPSIRHLVLDEADILLDPLFRPQTLAIWEACNNPLLQSTLWSATIGSSIESLAQSTILARRRALGLSSLHHLIRVVVGLKDCAIPTITHRLTYAATEVGKLLALRQILHPTAPSSSGDEGPSLRPPFLVFTQTIQRAIALHSELLYDIPPEAGGSSRIAVLHSDLSDSARAGIMAGFRKGEIWILITTDLLSRGVDFRGMNGVVNYDIPTTGASYVHRAGRTGRQGRAGGVAITLYTKEDIPYVKNVANVIAAGEKAKAKAAGEVKGKAEETEGGMQKWLLDALPSVSKKTKQELKRRGVESRRGFTGGEREKEKRRARISTKSGYDRRMEHRRKAVVKGTRERGMDEAYAAGEDEWGGFED